MSKAAFLVVFACCCFFTAGSAPVQPFSFKHYTTNDGLLHSVVFRLHQDSNGVLWAGTDYGLSRFDGRRFKGYHAGRGTGNGVLSVVGLPGNRLAMAYYRQGIYTISTRHHDSVVAFPLRNPTALSSKLIQLLVKGSELWTLDYKGVPGIIVNGGYKKVIVDGYVYKLRLIGDTLWMATKRGLYRWNGTAAVPVCLLSEVYDVVQDQDGMLWISSAGKLSTYSNGRLRTRYRLASQVRIQVLIADHRNRIWLANTAGELCYILDGEWHAVSATLRLNRIMVNDIKEDRDGNIWVATYGDGIYCFYQHLFTNFSVRSGLADQYLIMLHEDRDHRVWAGTLTGISRFDGERFHAVHHPDYLPQYPMKAMLHDPSGEYIFATYMRLITADQQLKTTWKLDSPGTALLRGRNGKIYIGSYGIVYEMTPRTHQLQAFRLQNSDNRVNRFLEDAQGILWLATDSGLFYTNDLHHFRSYFAHDGLSDNKVNDICLDDQGDIWVATERGLNMIRNFRVMRQYVAADGLGNDQCNTLAYDHHNKGLWIGTVKGICFFNHRSFYRLNTEQGLASDETNVLLADSCRQLWIGTVNGLSVLDLSRISFAQLPPQICIDEIRSNDHALFADGTETPRFRHDQNNFTVYFSSPEYIHPRTLSFSYRLNEHTWKETPNAQIDFANLAPGSYSLYVRAKSKTGAWGSPVVWRFMIDPPVWRTMWFTIVVSGMLACGVWLVAVRRIRKVRAREKEKLSLYKKMQALRQQSLTSLLSPHFVFNSLNSIQHYIGTYDKRSASEYLARFATLIRKTMDDASQVCITLEDELEHLGLYLALEKMRFGERLEYEISVDPRIDKEETFVPSMLIQPYVENAIWHGLMHRKEGGKVNVILEPMEQEYIRIRILDNGVGMQQNSERIQLHRPMGTRIMQQRMELLSVMLERPVRLSVQAGDAGTGTCVIIEVPHISPADIDRF